MITKSADNYKLDVGPQPYMIRGQLHNRVMEGGDPKDDTRITKITNGGGCKKGIT